MDPGSLLTLRETAFLRFFYQLSHSDRRIFFTKLVETNTSESI